MQMQLGLAASKAVVLIRTGTASMHLEQVDSKPYPEQQLLTAVQALLQTHVPPVLLAAAAAAVAAQELAGPCCPASWLSASVSLPFWQLLEQLPVPLQPPAAC